MSFRPRLPRRRPPAATPPGGLRCVELVELVTEYLEDALAPEAGLAVYVRGDNGKLASARIYDDADPPLRSEH